MTGKEDAISELKSIQRKYENSVKEIERLKEQQKRTNWRTQGTKRIGGLETNNLMLQKMGEGVLGRLNLGAGTTTRPGEGGLGVGQS